MMRREREIDEREIDRPMERYTDGSLVVEIGLGYSR